VSPKNAYCARAKGSCPRPRPDDPRQSAESALDYIVSRRHSELGELLDSAPVDDEPSTPEEEAAVEVARQQLARGQTVSLDEIRAELA
jgi:hypothetical protein